MYKNTFYFFSFATFVLLSPWLCFSNFSRVFVQELVLIFFRFTASCISWWRDFQEPQKSSEKHACENLGGAKFFIAHVMMFVATLPSFRKPITPWHDHLPFSFQAYSSSMLWSPLSIALSFMTSHKPIFLIHIHPFIFFHSFFLANKTIQFPFDDYITLLSFIHIVATEIFSSIVLPIIL